MKKGLFLSITLVILIVAIPTMSQAITIGFDPVTQIVPVGSMVDVDLVISDLGFYEAPSLGVFDLDIIFDPTILGFASVTFGDPVLGDQLDLWGLGSITDVVPGVGTVNLFELSLDFPWDLDDFQADSFTLATLTFDTLAVGTSSLDIFVNALGGAWGDSLTADVQSGSISPVPEPATILLIGTGLFGLGYLKRKKRIRS